MSTSRALLRHSGILLINLAVFAVTLWLWVWVQGTRFDAPASAAIILVGSVLMVPVAWAGRRWLDHDPSPRRLQVATSVVHWVVMASLGAAMIEALKTGRGWPGWTLPLPPALGWVLMWITGAAGVLVVLNLAVRGLGAPWSIALSRRLATDCPVGARRRLGGAAGGPRLAADGEDLRGAGAGAALRGGVPDVPGAHVHVLSRCPAEGMNACPVRGSSGRAVRAHSTWHADGDHLRASPGSLWEL
jgi:hypothetical protein